MYLTPHQYYEKKPNDEIPDLYHDVWYNDLQYSANIVMYDTSIFPGRMTLTKYRGDE